MIKIENKAPDSSYSLRDIAFSKDFRRIQDKTQMFNTRISEHFRTRMTHTIEVSVIAEELVREIQNIFDELDVKIKLDKDIVRSIAFAHDIGHTPFGHSGEEQINSLLENEEYFFKHNINSIKILLDPRENNINNTTLQKRYEFNFQLYDWRIFDGVIKHTKSYPRNCNKEILKKEDPYNLKYYFQRHKVLGNSEFCEEIKKFIITQNYNYETIDSKNFIDIYLNYKSALSIEGQIIALADEIAQRISDLDDSIRLFHKLNSKIEYKELIKELIEALKKLELNVKQILDDTSMLLDTDEIKKIKIYKDAIHDENDSKKISNGTANCAKLIAKHLENIIVDEYNINTYAKKISKKLRDFLIKNTVIYIKYLVRNKKLKTQKITLLYKENDEKKIKVDYNLVCPIIIEKIYEKNIKKSFIDFPLLIQNTIVDILENFNKKIIADKVIKTSNDKGCENLEKLYEIYKKDVSLVDTNTKRNIMTILNEEEFEKVIKLYEDKKHQKIINLLILEGIARMTDTYVERLISYNTGFSHFSYNKQKLLKKKNN